MLRIVGTKLRRKEIQILLIERDKVISALHGLEENRGAGKVSKLDYDILRGRYEDKLRKIEQKLGKPEPKPGRLAGLRFWRKKPKRKA